MKYTNQGLLYSDANRDAMIAKTLRRRDERMDR